ncbi:MAG: AMP-binding protein [Catalinimonas sp.]
MPQPASDTTISRPWLDHYPPGIEWDVPVDTFQNIMELLEATFERYRDHPAQENLGHTMTYREVEEQSRHLAAFFQANGLRPGETLAIQMPNVLQYEVALFAAIRAGLRVVNLNPLYTPAELRKPLIDSEARGIVVLANFADKIEAVLPDVPDLKLRIVTEIGDLLPGLKRPLINFVVKRVKKMVPAYNIPGAVSLRQALRSGSQQPYERPEIPSGQTLFLQYTGGTTGVPKAAELTHANLVANVLQCTAGFGGLVPGDEVIIAALPFYHIFGLSVNCFLLVHSGAKLVLITNPRDIKGFLKTMSKTRFTIFSGLNTLFNAMMNHPDFEKIDFSHSRLFVAGGMALQPAIGERWRKLTGHAIMEGYGLSETSPVLSCNHPTQNEPGTIGQPFPRTDMVIMDDDGKPLPPGERGEICARGPQVMPRYFKRPDETERVFTADGWFRTGDIGTMDERGFFRIVDRKKDMILVSGFNVYPNEVEAVLAEHPGVLECAVIGVPDAESTERVKACVVRKDAALTEESVIAHCRESLAGYKVPKVVAFYDEMPKSNVGKILRRELR